MATQTQSDYIEFSYDGACALLAGQEVQGKKGGIWVIQERVQRKRGSSGGNFSIGYRVQNKKSGQTAFMKATDTGLIGSDNALETLLRVTQEHHFERTVLDFCQGSNMDKIVYALDYGDMRMVSKGVAEQVFYIVFELANGDSRDILIKDSKYDFLWVLHALHNLAVALKQLHTKAISHNDIKPSNLLVYGDIDHKLGDLGRATHMEMAGPFDNFPCPGDKRYAAPEQLYRSGKGKYWVKTPLDQRRASDLYLLGSMIYFFVTHLPISMAINQLLPPQHMPINWQGDYDEILPFWRDAFGKAMLDFSASLPKTPFGKEHPLNADICTIVRQLCEPDPTRRGHPLNHAEKNPFGLDRYISFFDTALHKYQLAL